MHRNTASTTILLLFALAIYSCGDSSRSGDATWGLVPYSDIPATDVTADDDVSRSTSATFLRFFNDSVNAASTGRWMRTNSSGSKAWVLSNTCFSTPKAWVIGQNYWNRESDTLTSNTFTIPEFTAGIRLSFYSRWSILAGDSATVEYSIDGGAWTTLTTFTGGNNPAYPSWDKYYFELPDNMAPGDQSWQIRYTFTSNTSGTSWGFGVDSVSVYQRQLETPSGFAAAGEGDNPFDVTLSWNPSADPLEPVYDIYRSDSGAPNTFDYIGTVNDPDSTTSFVHNPGNASTYYYQVHALVPGWPEALSSVESASGILLEIPTGVEASDGIGDNPYDVTITWDASTDSNSPDSYTIYRSATGTPGTFSLIATVNDPASNTEYLDNPGDASNYHYHARAVKSGWPDSEPSSADIGQGAFLATPTGVQASDGTLPGSIGISWDLSTDPNDPELYDAYMSSSGLPGTFTHVNSMDNPDVNGGLVVLTSDQNTYYFLVRASKPGWPDSADSNIDSGFGL